MNNTYCLMIPAIPSCIKLNSSSSLISFLPIPIVIKIRNKIIYLLIKIFQETTWKDFFFQFFIAYENSGQHLLQDFAVIFRSGLILDIKFYKWHLNDYQMNHKYFARFSMKLTMALKAILFKLSLLKRIKMVLTI
jgi:hypothetical protein